MVKREFEAHRKKYQVLPYFGIPCSELGRLKHYKCRRMRAQFLLCLLRVNVKSKRSNEEAKSLKLEQGFTHEG